MHQQRNDDLKILEDLGVHFESTHQHDKEFGRAEALAYEQLFDEAKIDNLHVITIGTMGNDTFGYLLGSRVQEMVDSIAGIFNSEQYGHSADKNISGQGLVEYYNPEDSYWHNQGNLIYKSSFHYGVNQIRSKDMKEDKDWDEIISHPNLKLAWARARANMLRESFYDEIEIRLFEQNLEANLWRLQEQLINYKTDIVPLHERIEYQQPKNERHTRPRGLTRLEEEILSVAIIQKLGLRISNENSYAYRIKGEHSRHSTEYLYGSSWNAYQNYLNDARLAAEHLPENGVVLQVDIKRFFEKVIQQQLLDVASEGLQTSSDRVKWLLKQLFLIHLLDHQKWSTPSFSE